MNNGIVELNVLALFTEHLLYALLYTLAAFLSQLCAAIMYILQGRQMVLRKVK